jgi:PhnB protein
LDERSTILKLNPYLLFNGQCEAAFKFYAQCLGGKIEAMMPHAGTPAEKQAGPEWREKILHACLSVDGELLMGSDAPPQHYEPPQGFSVSIQPKDPAAAERMFNQLAEQGIVKMPFQQTFWAYRFGMLVDRFGIPWIINCEKAA